jgi:hypothetical protein
MKSFLLFIGSGLLLLVSCNNDNKPSSAKQAVADTAKFFPLEGFFKKQVEYVDLRNFSMYRLTVKDGKKDSVAISKDEFIGWSNVFMEKAFRDPKQKILYKETVFEDLSTGSYTLNYAATGASVPVRNIDILLDHETNQVKRIFIKSLYNRGDTTVEEQANWKADKSFQVNRFLQTMNGYKSTELNYVNWNDR